MSILNSCYATLDAKLFEDTATDILVLLVKFSFTLAIYLLYNIYFLGVPGVGPYGFVGTNVPGFPTGYPLGTKWKMTDHGYVLDRSGFQHPLSPHSGELRNTLLRY